MYVSFVDPYYYLLARVSLNEGSQIDTVLLDVLKDGAVHFRAYNKRITLGTLANNINR